jgi:hypothetical protein
VLVISSLFFTMSSVTIPVIPANASMEDKMDIMLQLLVQQTKSIALFQGKIEELEKENNAMKSTIGSLSKEIFVLKNSSNRREQHLLNNSIRIFGVAVHEDEPNTTDGGKALAGRVFEKILKPILVAAKIKGANVANVIETCYRAGKASSDKARPPPVVVKLCSPSLRLTILRNKKTGMAPPSEADQRLGIKRFTVVEDLTGDSFKLLRTLAGDSRVEKVWTIDGNIRFTLTGDSTSSIKRVKSVYDSIDKIVAT